MAMPINNNIIPVPQASFDRIVARLDEQDARIAAQDLRNIQQDARIAEQASEIIRLTNRGDRNEEVIRKAITALDASLASSRITCNIVCAASIAIAGGAIGLLAAPLIGVALPTIAALEGIEIAGTAGVAVGALGGGAAGGFGLGPVVHGAIYKNQIQELDTLKLQLNEFEAEHAPMVQE